MPSRPRFLPERVRHWSWTRVLSFPIGASLLLLALIVVLQGAPATTSAANGSWATYQHDNNRSGVDPDQPPATGAALDWTLTLDASIFAQPLVVGNVVIAATERNSVYAIDATTHATIWRTNLGPPATSGLAAGCGNPHGTPTDPAGITGTPVVDTANGIVYVAALTQPGVLQYVLAALDLPTGALRYQVPINPVTGPSLPPFVTAMQDQRSALTLSQGRVYVAFGGLNGDCNNYRGWVWGASASDGSGSVSYEVPATAAGAAVWAPGGASTDAAGNLFVSTGNSQQTAAPDHSESVIRLSPSLQETSFFTSSTWSSMNSGDLDLSSFGPLQLTNSQFSQYNGLILQAGKNGQGYILRGSALGGVGGQVFTGPLCTAEVHGGAAYVPPTVYLPCRNQLLAVTLSTSGSPSFSVSTVRSGYSGGNTSAAGTPIWSGGLLWNLDIGNRNLVIMNTTSGVQQTLPLNQTSGHTPTHFAPLSSGAGHIFVSDGSDLRAFLITPSGQPPTPTSTPPATSTPTPTSAPASTSTPTPTRTSTPTSAPTSTRTPTPTPTSAGASTSTPTPTRTSTPTPTGTVGSTVTVVFDDLPNPNRPLTGQYPTGVIDWGTTANWYLSGPYDHFTSNSVSFGPSPTSATLTFVSPRVLVQLDADNGGTATSTVSLTCAGLPAVQATINVHTVQTIVTGWSSPCTSLTIASSNGWNTNFDNLVVSSGAVVNTPTPTRTPTSAATATPTPTRAATATLTPTATATPTSGASQTLTFDDLPNPNRSLTGQYPTGVANWGTGAWYLSGPWGLFTTNSVSFNGPSLTSASLTFTTPKRLVQLDAYNGGSDASTVTFACNGQPTVGATVPVARVITITTGWTGPCSMLTITSTNGWHTNFDNLVLQ